MVWVLLRLLRPLDGADALSAEAAAAVAADGVVGEGDGRYDLKASGGPVAEVGAAEAGAAYPARGPSVLPGLE